MDSEKVKYSKFCEKAEELFKNRENNPNDKYGILMNLSMS